MRIGYGFNRADADFEGLRVEELFIDAPNSGRVEWLALMEGLRPGTVVVVVDLDDLPDQEKAERQVQAGFAVIQVHQDKGEPPEPEWQKGPIPDEAKAFIQPWWHSGVSLDHINRVLRRHCGCGPFNRNALNYYLKRRTP